MFGETLVGKVQIALQFVDVDDLAALQRRQRVQYVGLVVELLAFNHDALEFGFNDHQLDNTILEVLLGHFDLDRAVTGLEVGFLQRL